MAEGNFPNIENYLKKWNELLIEALRKSAVEQMQENKSKAKFPSFGDPQASPLIAGIKPRFTIFGTTVEAVIIMPSEWKWLEGGRKPGKMPPEEPIIKWIVHRGIRIQKVKGGKDLKMILKNRTVRKGLKQYNMDKERKQLAFLIRKKIARDGTRATHFFSNVVTDKLISDLKLTMKEKFKKDITVQLLTIIN